MLNNIKISTKIVIGFSIVLILMLMVGYIGMTGMTGTVDRVVKADDVNRMVKMIQQARQHEKNFIIRGDQQYVDKVSEELTILVKQVNETKEKFDQPVNKEQMDQVLTRVNEYNAAFSQYVAIEKEKTLLMELMRTCARDSVTKLEEIRTDQKRQLDSDIKK